MHLLLRKKAMDTRRRRGAGLRVPGLAAVPHYWLVHKVQYVEALHLCVPKIELRAHVRANAWTMGCHPLHNLYCLLILGDVWWDCSDCPGYQDEKKIFFNISLAYYYFCCRGYQLERKYWNIVVGIWLLFNIRAAGFSNLWCLKLKFVANNLNTN